MSALPQRNLAPEPKRDRDVLTDALRTRASSKAAVARLDRELELTMQHGAERLEFAWATDDEREADMEIYYQPWSNARVLAVKLVLLDGQAPTIPERLEFETAFAAEMDAAGATWEMVASYIWEREASESH